jgi:hypothetical protein
VRALPVSYVTLRYSLAQFRRVSDDFVKWCSLPYPQAVTGLTEAENELDQISRGTEAQPFIMLLPAVRRAMETGALLERRHAMLRAVEAIRMFAATHDGKPPQKLEDLAATPIPPDALTGLPFTYRVDGDTATLSAPSTPANVSKSNVREYHIRVAPIADRK